MSQQDQWEKMRATMVGQWKPKTVKERETVPEKACAKCKYFAGHSQEEDGTGYCRKLKTGSDLKKVPPVLVEEGDAALMIMFNMDASKCPYYEKRMFIDTDGTEAHNPRYSVGQIRQMGGKGKA